MSFVTFDPFKASLLNKSINLYTPPPPPQKKYYTDSKLLNSL